MKVCTFDENDAAEMVEDRPPLIPYVRCDIGQSFCADADLPIVAFLFEYKNSRAEYNREIGKLVQQEAKMNLENCQTEITSRINCRLWYICPFSVTVGAWTNFVIWTTKKIMSNKYFHLRFCYFMLKNVKFIINSQIFRHGFWLKAFNLVDQVQNALRCLFSHLS